MSYSHYTVCACVSVMMLPWILGDRLLNSDQCFRSFVYRDETLLECMPCVFCFLHIRQTSVSVFRDDAVSEEQVCFHSNQGRNSSPPSRSLYTSISLSFGGFTLASGSCSSLSAVTITMELQQKPLNLSALVINLFKV